jgi:hypothetical protein
MLNKSKHIALICGATSIAVTVIFYLLTYNNIFTVPMRWVSLLFLIFAEAIGTVKALTVKKTVFGVSNIVTSIAHIAAVLVLSIVFVNIFPLLIAKYILLNILALCILMVVDVVILYFTNRGATQNRKMNESQSVMGACVEKASSLCVEFGSTDYKKDLEEIVELLRYSDNSCLTQDEMTIMNKLGEVQLLLKNNDEGIAEKIVEIKNAIELRSIKVKSAKRGSY